jgi:hypothetical protein
MTTGLPSKDWIARMADGEDQCESVSVGGMAADSEQWTPVSERLPPDGAYVLGWETIHEAFLVVLRKDGRWFYAQGRLAGWRVTHWMPLPEPPCS